VFLRCAEASVTDYSKKRMFVYSEGRLETREREKRDGSEQVSALLTDQ
jgi:hypothetical protein